MKILHLIDDRLGPDAMRRLERLAPALAGEDSVEICCLGGIGDSAAPLRSAGIAVHLLGWSRGFDPVGFWNLRCLLQAANADVIHAWDVSALRVLALAGPNLLSRTILSAELPCARKLGWLDRWLVRRVTCRPEVDVVAAIPLTPNPSPTVGRGANLNPLTPNPSPVGRGGARSGWPRIVCAGRAEREAGFRQAIWTFDYLLVPYPAAELHIAGAGPYLDSLQALALGLGSAGSVRFLGAVPDVAAVLQDADVVWTPSLTDCGRAITLEAMALGKPVIASDVPSLRELVRDGETGWLVRPGDVIALARRTHAILRDPALRERIGSAGRRFVESHFNLESAARQWRQAYRTAAA